MDSKPTSLAVQDEDIPAVIVENEGEDGNLLDQNLILRKKSHSLYSR